MSKTEQIAELTSQMNKLLRSNPENGEQWAEICRLESLIVELQGG